jgi:hypothetical protein
MFFCYNKAQPTQVNKMKKTNKTTSYMILLLTKKGMSIDDIVIRQGHDKLTWNDLANFTEQMPESIQKDVFDTLTMIDYDNADLLHYLNFQMDNMLAAMDEGGFSLGDKIG